MSNRVKCLIMVIFSLLVISCNEDNHIVEEQVIDEVSIQLIEGAECVKGISIYSDAKASANILVNGKKIPLPIAIHENEVQEDTMFFFDKAIDKVRVVFVCSNEGSSTHHYEIICKFQYHGNIVKMRRFSSNLQVGTQKQFLVDV